MDEAIGYLTSYSFIEIANILFFSITLIVIVVRAIEKMGKKVYSYFIYLYNAKRGKEVEEETIGNSIKKIKELSNSVEEIEQQQKRNVAMFTEHELEIIHTLETLSENMTELSGLVKNLDSKIDKQQQEIKRNNKATTEVDLTLLRDRILGAMRYFNQNVDELGRVHISMSDHENLSHLFDEYFKRNGNGSIKKKYENEFSKFIIDD